MELAIYTFDIPMVPYRDIPVLPRPQEAIPELKAAGVTAIEAGYHFFITYPERVVEKKQPVASPGRDQDMVCACSLWG